MRRIVLACTAGLCLLIAAPAGAAPVLVLENGRVRTENDRFVPDTPLPPAMAHPSSAPARTAQASVPALLDRLLASGQITQAARDTYRARWDEAVVVRSEVRGTAQREQAAAMNVLASLAGRGQLTASRLPVLFVQLDRNTKWWGLATRLPYPGERVRAGSRVLLQYVPGQGLQFHPLANWGRAQALLRHGYTAQGVAMVNELLPLGSMRGSALAWEYFFWFGGGRPPWTSGLSQGTALIALSYAFERTRDERFAAATRQAVTLYTLPAPLGVRVGSRWGAHYAEYSFAPSYRIINGFVQALNGLWDAWHKVGYPTAAALFRSGENDARHALPYYDIGRWSRYSNRGEISNVNYHVLLRDFLSGLCSRSRIGIYCAKASRFSYYLRRFGRPPSPPRGWHIV